MRAVCISSVLCSWSAPERERERERDRDKHLNFHGLANHQLDCLNYKGSVHSKTHIIRFFTSTKQELDHLEVSLVAGQGQCTLLEFIGVGVDVSTILKEQLGHAYKDNAFHRLVYHFLHSHCTLCASCNKIYILCTPTLIVLPICSYSDSYIP